MSLHTQQRLQPPAGSRPGMPRLPLAAAVLIPALLAALALSPPPAQARGGFQPKTVTVFVKPSPESCQYFHTSCNGETRTREFSVCHVTRLERIVFEYWNYDELTWAREAHPGAEVYHDRMFSEKYELGLTIRSPTVRVAITGTRLLREKSCQGVKERALGPVRVQKEVEPGGEVFFMVGRDGRFAQ